MPSASTLEEGLVRDTAASGNAARPLKVAAGACLVLMTLVLAMRRDVLGVMVAACLGAQVVGSLLGAWVLSIGEGTEEMKKVGNAIREGSEAYVKTMFGTIFKLLLPFAVLVFIFYVAQGDSKKAAMITLSFLSGAVCSSCAGMIGMWSSTRANARVAQTSCTQSYKDTIIVALRSGAVAGITVVSLAVLGISLLFMGCHAFVEPRIENVPVLLVGYGFGASFVAMFAQLGGGIYTKAADVGADLVGKTELDLPEDDPRNPAVVADLVGDNVGDCCARGADLFESLSAEIIGAMILGGSLVERNVTEIPSSSALKYIAFPLAVHVMDLVVSTIGVMAVRPDNKGRDDGGKALEDPMRVLTQGYMVAVSLAMLAFIFTTRALLYTEAAPNAWWHFAICGFIGALTGLLIVKITEFYTDFVHRPVIDVAKASVSGHGTNIIAGLGVGFESAMLPIITVVVAILSTYFLGKSSGLQTTASDPEAAAGLFGTAVATMGMLSNLTYVLAMDVFGPITDNAAGIVEMSPSCPEAARDAMDRLDAAGNTTKAFTKGFAVGSAGLACFLLFNAFLDLVREYSGATPIIDIVKPEIFCAGIIGSATVFLFVAYAMQAVGSTAEQVVTEVRRQFAEMPGIKDGSEKPEYGRCVAIVSQAAIGKMVAPGLLVVLMPVVVGIAFRILGRIEEDMMLGAKGMTAYLVCSSMTAMLTAFLLNNGGGAWDNAKKLVESGKHGGKGSPAHKAAVTGDTVGDPCKDTAGPSLHVLMKLTATVTMIVGPLVAVGGQ